MLRLIAPLPVQGKRSDQMPTGNSAPTARRRAMQIALGLAVLVAVVLAWAWQPITAQAEAGTAFGARIGCSCRHVDGRALESCEDDFLDGMGLVSLSGDAEAKTVTASVPFLASTTATFREGWGCLLEPYEP